MATFVLVVLVFALLCAAWESDEKRQNRQYIQHKITERRKADRDYHKW